MASGFTGSNPQVDSLPDAPATQVDHDDMHNDERAGIRAVQQWIRTYVLPIFANGWVTNNRIATGAVTPSKMGNGDYYFGGHVNSTGHIGADGHVFGLDGVRAGPVAIGHPITFTAWVRALTNGSGAATIQHNIPTLQRRVINSSAWFRGAGGEARNLLPTGYVIDGTNVTITGAPANTRVRVGITYMADNDSDWA